MQIIGAAATRAPGTTLLLLPGVPIDFLIMALDKEGITVSTGTSCKSRSRSPSAALLSMGYSEAEALSVVRLSYGQNLTTAEMEIVSTQLAGAVQRLA
jgi:cysteine desulfurase